MFDSNLVANQGGCQTIQLASFGPLETWLNMHTMESGVFATIPVRDGRLVPTNITIVLKSDENPTGNSPAAEPAVGVANATARKDATAWILLAAMLGILFFVLSRGSA